MLDSKWKLSKWLKWPKDSQSASLNIFCPNNSRNGNSNRWFRRNWWQNVSKSRHGNSRRWSKTMCRITRCRLNLYQTRNLQLLLNTVNAIRIPNRWLHRSLHWWSATQTIIWLCIRKICKWRSTYFVVHRFADVIICQNYLYRNFHLAKSGAYENDATIQSSTAFVEVYLIDYQQGKFDFLQYCGMGKIIFIEKFSPGIFRLWPVRKSDSSERKSSNSEAVLSSDNWNGIKRGHSIDCSKAINTSNNDNQQTVGRTDESEWFFQKTPIEWANA